MFELLNKDVCSVLQKDGILDLLPVQKHAIKEGLLTGQSEIIIAPTSSGKTLIGEIAAVHKEMFFRYFFRFMLLSVP